MVRTSVGVALPQSGPEGGQDATWAGGARIGPYGLSRPCGRAPLRVLSPAGCATACRPWRAMIRQGWARGRRACRDAPARSAEHGEERAPRDRWISRRVVVGSAQHEQEVLGVDVRSDCGHNLLHLAVDLGNTAVSIFIASMEARRSPRATRWPAATESETTMPRMARRRRSGHPRRPRVGPARAPGCGPAPSPRAAGRSARRRLSAGPRSRARPRPGSGR